MSIKAGLVGLPNVGKSTLFNALTKSQVPAENYPFCTIDPHIAITEVPDERLDKLQKIYGSIKQIPSTVTFVDIAGLVQGAASGEGLGNQFLNHIQGVDLILHVVRCFDNPNIISTRGEIDPLNDFHIIVSELMLKDLETVTKRLEKLEGLIKRAQSKPQELKELTSEKELLEKVKIALDNAQAEKVRDLLSKHSLSTIPLLCAKNFMIIANVSEDELEDDGYKKNQHYQTLIQAFGEQNVVAVSAKLEGELIQLSDEEAQEIMTMLNIKKRGLNDIIKKTYDNLGLITFFTCGPKEAHAWPIAKGMTVKQAGGEIHSDIQRGFICAEIFNCKDLFALGSEQKVKEAGKMRIEGADYIVQDGDTLHIRFNV